MAPPLPPLATLGLLALAAYLAGSVPFGVLFARARGVDLRAVGSGNIGATNAARALGARVGVLVFLCDAAKGALPALLGVWLAAHALAPAEAPAVAGFAAFLGHLTSPFVGGKGGKGVATAFGVFVVLSPLAALVALAAFAVLYAKTRLSSVGSLGAATLFVPAVWLATRRTDDLVLAAALWALIVARHRDNLGRLLRHAEHRVEPPPRDLP